MSKSIIRSPHDKLFRAAMQYPEVAREFLDMHLPEFIKKDLDFSSITICPNTFVDEDLKLFQSRQIHQHQRSYHEMFWRMYSNLGTL